MASPNDSPVGEPCQTGPHPTLRPLAEPKPGGGPHNSGVSITRHPDVVYRHWNLLFREEVITMKKTHLNYGVLTILVLTLLVLVVTPAASAKAEFLPFVGTETFDWDDFAVDVVLTGGVAHATGGGAFTEDGTGDLLDGINTTHLVVVFDPLTGEGRCHGTFVIDTHDCADVGLWVGTFAGSMTFPTMGNGEQYLYDIRVTGRGTSGDVAGMTFIANDVKSLPYSNTADVTGTIIAPHGF